jgi:hypothetical protein
MGKISKKVTFEGQVHHIDGRQRVSADVVKRDHVEQYHYLTGHTLASTGAPATSSKTFTQPANTVITDAWIHCTDAPTFGSGSTDGVGHDGHEGADVGLSAGTHTSGVGHNTIIAYSRDSLLDSGSTISAGLVRKVGLLGDDSNAAGDLGDSMLATTASRTVNLMLYNTVNTNSGSHVGGTADVGSFTWVLKTLEISPSTPKHGDTHIDGL